MQVHQNVFQQGVLPSNYAGFGHWPYFDMNAAMFSLNGLQPQGSYGKSNPMNPRSRNLKYVFFVCCNNFSIYPRILINQITNILFLYTI
jgi:hypothetical protein